MNSHNFFKELFFNLPGHSDKKLDKTAGRRRWMAIILIGVLMFGTTLTGCKARSGPPQMQAEVAVVAVYPERLVMTTELPARVSAFRIAEIRPRVSGLIQKRLFTEGSLVLAGDVLYEIDPAPFQAAFDNANATFARAKAGLRSIRLRTGRYRQLLADKAVSQQEYDDALAAMKQAEAEVKFAQASARMARIRLEYTRVTAPISGRIGKSSVTDGAIVMEYQPMALASIQQLNPVYVDIPQSAAELMRLQRSLKEGRLYNDQTNQSMVRLVLTDETSYPQVGTLQFKDITVDSTTGSVILRAVFPNPDDVLLPGMFVRAVVVEGVNDEAILVPQQGVSRTPKGDPITLVVGAGDKVEQRVLTIDRAIGDKWLVSSGLNPGDRVIVEGVQKVRPGVQVRVVPFESGNQTDGPQTKAAHPPAH